MRAQRDQLREIVIATAKPGPLSPPDRVVLAIRIVVAFLTVGDFVAGEQQRNALSQKKTGHHAGPKAVPQFQDFGVVGRPFDTAVRTHIVVGAVLIVLTILLVVLG